MKITSNSISNRYKNTGKVIKSNFAQMAQTKISKNFDKITISSNTSISEDKFAHELASRISKEVKTATPSYKMEDIKSQIEEGTYQIGLDEVVKKIMLG